LQLREILIRAGADDLIEALPILMRTLDERVVSFTFVCSAPGAYSVVPERFAAV
jgi:hypothetical protein